MENGKHETALTLPHVQQLGDVLYKSGYFGDIKSAAQATVKVLRGQELGLGPVTALEQIHVVQGKTALGAGLIGALIKRSGRYNYRVIKHTDNECEIAFFENNQEIGRSVFTLKDAEKAGLLKKDVWRQYPRNLLFARSLSNGAKWYTPDVFGGAVYTPEELQAIDVEATVINEKPQEEKPQSQTKTEKSQSQTQKQSAKDEVTAKVQFFASQKGYNSEIFSNHVAAILCESYEITSVAKLTEKQWQAIAKNVEKLLAKAEERYVAEEIFPEDSREEVQEEYSEEAAGE